MSKNELRKNQKLQKGECLKSNNGTWTAMLKPDGNFVIFNPCGTVWESDTAGSDVDRLVMQEDSNLVMYNNDGKARWHSNTYVPMPPGRHSHATRHDCHLELTDDGILVLHRGPDKVWSSVDSKDVKGN